MLSTGTLPVTVRMHVLESILMCMCAPECVRVRALVCACTFALRVWRGEVCCAAGGAAWHGTAWHGVGWCALGMSISVQRAEMMKQVMPTTIETKNEPSGSDGKSCSVEYGTRTADAVAISLFRIDGTMYRNTSMVTGMATKACPPNAAINHAADDKTISTQLRARVTP